MSHDCRPLDCPECRADLAQIVREPYVCETCGGEGVVAVEHPRWGSITCPDPTLDVPCPDCRGGAA